MIFKERHASEKVNLFLSCTIQNEIYPCQRSFIHSFYIQKSEGESESSH